MTPCNGRPLLARSCRGIRWDRWRRRPRRRFWDRALGGLKGTNDAGPAPRRTLARRPEARASAAALLAHAARGDGGDGGRRDAATTEAGPSAEPPNGGRSPVPCSNGKGSSDPAASGRRGIPGDDAGSRESPASFETLGLCCRGRLRRRAWRRPSRARGRGRAAARSRARPGSSPSSRARAADRRSPTAWCCAGENGVGPRAACVAGPPLVVVEAVRAASLFVERGALARALA